MEISDAYCIPLKMCDITALYEMAALKGISLAWVSVMAVLLGNSTVGL